MKKLVKKSSKTVQQRVVSMLRRNWTDAAIRKNTKITVAQLAAYKAHYTMGHYDSVW